MTEKFEFWPEPNTDELWWSSLATTVKHLSELLANRPQEKKPEPSNVVTPGFNPFDESASVVAHLRWHFDEGHDLVVTPKVTAYAAIKALADINSAITPKPAVKIEGTMTTADLPKATIISNERVYSVPDIARFLGVSINFIHRRAVKGLLETFSPVHFNGSRKYVREAELKRFLGNS
jgi:hypothetical protein